MKKNMAKPAFFGFLAALVVSSSAETIVKTERIDASTLTGKVMCAKCALKKADASKCQDVLVTKSEDGKIAEYYIEKTAAAEAFGHVCQSEKKAVVTGTTIEKDGKTWIAPSKMEEKS